jgi:enoyl-CoA hydratase/carnithine racemase
VPLAKEILMTGRMFDGAEAAARGLVTAWHPAEELAAAAQDFARHIAELAPLSVQGAKRSMRLISDATRLRARDPDAVASIDALVARAYASRDLAEGVRALADKRPPEFTGD